MAANCTDQFFVMDPASPPKAGTNLEVQLINLTDQNEDGDIDRFNNDAAGGLDVRSTWPGDTVTVDVPGVGEITYVGTSLYLSDGSVIFTPNDGQVLSGGEFVSSTYVTSQGPLFTSQLGPPCFVQGTRILTPDGERRVEDLRVGEPVVTLDKGSVALLHLSRRELTTTHLAENPRHGPIRVPRQVFTGDAEDGDLFVSPQHRLLIRSMIAERMFGAREVLAPAAQLLGYKGIERADLSTPVAYCHLIFDHHAIVIANGIESESLYLGQNAICEFDRVPFLALRQVLTTEQTFQMQSAREFVFGKRLKRLLARHSKNDMPLSEPIDWNEMLVA